jgi:hypothetical protein
LLNIKLTIFIYFNPLQIKLNLVSCIDFNTRNVGYL